MPEQPAPATSMASGASKLAPATSTASGASKMAPAASGASDPATELAASAVEPAPQQEEERDSSSKSTEASGTDESSASEGEDSDSDDSSDDLDEDTWTGRRSQLLSIMGLIEKDFGVVKELLYQTKMMQVDEKLGRVKAGTANEYLEPLKKLEENCETRHKVATELRRLKLEAVDRKYEADEQASRQNYESEKQIIFDTIKEDIDEKLRRLEEDRHNLATSDLWQETKTNRRKCRSEGASAEKRKKAIAVSGPVIVYTLTDAEIMEDWTIIKKSIIAQQQQHQQHQQTRTPTGGGPPHKRSKSSDIVQH